MATYVVHCTVGSVWHFQSKLERGAIGVNGAAGFVFCAGWMGHLVVDRID